MDCAMGGGSLLLAALDLGMSVIGIDISERACEITANRIIKGDVPKLTNRKKRGLEVEGMI